MKKSEILSLLDELVIKHYVNENGILFVRVRYLGWSRLNDVVDLILFIRPIDENEIEIEFDPSVKID